MLFSVRVDLTRGLELDPGELAGLRAEEALVAASLAARGVLLRLWRRADVPWGNIGLWQARDRDELDEAMSRLPLYPWMDIDVEAVVPHPSDPRLTDWVD